MSSDYNIPEIPKRPSVPPKDPSSYTTSLNRSLESFPHLKSPPPVPPRPLTSQNRFMPSQNNLDDNVVSPTKPVSPPQSKSRERKGPPQKFPPATPNSAAVQLATLGPKFPSPIMNRTGSSESLSNVSVAVLPGAPLTGNSLDMNLIPTSIVQSLTAGDDGKKGVNKIFGIVKGMFERETSRIEISSPYNPVHLTHVGYNQDTGELTGLPKEWQVLLTKAGITKEQQLANPQAVFDIINFYSAANGGNLDDEVWSKFSKAHALAKIAPGMPPKTISSDDSPKVPVKPNRDVPSHPVVPEKPPIEKRKPPIPERPKHTLTIYSTDLKSVESQSNK
ncbi:signal transducing kinase of the PAK, partial [Nowakowskiella sp. JEL0078]